MMETLFRGFDDVFWGLSSWFAHSPESLVDHETPDLEPNTLALGTGGLATGFDLAGSLTLLDGPAIGKLATRLAETFAANFARKGHALQFVFVRDPEGGREAVEKATKGMRATALRLHLDMADYFDTLEESLAQYVASESGTMVLFTDRGLLNRAEAAEEKKRPKSAPRGSGSQSLCAGIPPLRARHWALTASLGKAFPDSGLKVRELSASELLFRIRHGYAPEFTHPDWTPRLPGSSSFPLRFPDPGTSPKDFGHILWPSIEARSVRSMRSGRVSGTSGLTESEAASTRRSGFCFLRSPRPHLPGWRTPWSPPGSPGGPLFSSPGPGFPCKR